MVKISQLCGDHLVVNCTFYFGKLTPIRINSKARSAVGRAIYNLSKKHLGHKLVRNVPTLPSLPFCSKWFIGMEKVEGIILPLSFTTLVLQIHCQFLFEMIFNDIEVLAYIQFLIFKFIYHYRSFFFTESQSNSELIRKTLNQSIDFSISLNWTWEINKYGMGLEFVF